MSEYAMKNVEGFQFPYTLDTSVLNRQVRIGDTGITLKNSIAVHPMEASDADETGAPTGYTVRRYRRFAESGASLVWLEALAVQEDGRSGKRALWITEENLDAFKRLVEEIKAVSSDVTVVAQLTHSGRFSKPDGCQRPVIAMWNPHYNRRANLEPDYPLVTDEYLDRLQEQFVHVAGLCVEAGFDGVDVKACHGYLVSELLSCYTRHGRYGGSYENRTRFLLEVAAAMRETYGSKLLLASRFCYADTIPFPYGFGMARGGSDPFAYDYDEPIRLMKDMYAAGISLVNLSVGKPTANAAYLRGDIGDVPADSGIQYFNRFYQGTKALHEACPEMTVIGSDFSSLKEDAPYVAAGVLASGAASMVGFGRMALAYSGFADDMMNGAFDARRACIACGKCNLLLREGVPSGCPVRDQEVYLPLFMEHCKGYA